MMMVCFTLLTVMLISTSPANLSLSYTRDAEDDTRVLEPVVLKGHKCVLRNAGAEISSQCTRIGSVCSGPCLYGYLENPASVCEPASQRSVCRGTPGWVDVVFTHMGSCLANCGCKPERRLPEDERDRVLLYRCNI